MMRLWFQEFSIIFVLVYYLCFSLLFVFQKAHSVSPTLVKMVESVVLLDTTSSVPALSVSTACFVCCKYVNGFT